MEADHGERDVQAMMETCKGTGGHQGIGFTSAFQKLIIAAGAVVQDPLMTEGLNEQLSESDSSHLSQLPQIPEINQPLG